MRIFDRTIRWVPSERQIDDRLAKLSIQSARRRDQEAEAGRREAEQKARMDRLESLRWLQEQEVSAKTPDTGAGGSKETRYSDTGS